MIFLGLAALFFLPIIESFSRDFGFLILIFGTVCITLDHILKRREPRGWIPFLFFLTLVSFIPSLFYSISIERSLWEFTRYVSYFLLFLSFYTYSNKDVLCRYFLIPMVCVNSIILSILWVMFSFLPQEFSTQISGMNLFFPTFGHNRISELYIFSLPTFLFLWFTSDRKRKYVYLFFSISTFILLVFTQSRGSMIALSISFFLYILLSTKARNTLPHFISNVFSRLLSSAGILISVTVVFLIASFAYSHFFVAPGNDYSAIKGFYKPLWNERRIEYINHGFAGFQKSPIVGTGLETFRYVSLMFQTEKDHWSWYLHNHILELFIETGILGGVLFLSLILILLFQVNRSVQHSLDQFGVLLPHALFISLMASGIHSFLDYDWHFLSLFLLFWASAGILIGNKNTLKIWHSRLSVISLCILFGLTVALFILPKSKNVIEKSADLLEEKKEDEALQLLLSAYTFDRANGDISVKIADIYSEKGDWENAHLWYQRAIILQPFYQKYSLMQDIVVYLDEAESALGQSSFQEAQYTIRKAKVIYPYIYRLQTSTIDTLSTSEFEELIKSLKKESQQWDPSDMEILVSVDTIYSLNPEASLWQ
ncbi:O-antigen ligase family protein [Candidatus Gottesmanbacteria bacterium]|nr:O-antigen ligase family protein [Candidatus Gottesmanbacteria bacterium]